jgi:hypothetical protein
MMEIDWAKLFNCAIFAALMVMCIIVISIIIVSVIHLIGIFGYEWLVLIGIIFLLFVGLTYYAYKYNII